MNKTVLQLGGILLVLAICAAGPWIILHRAQPALQESGANLQRQMTAVAALASVNAQLSNALIQARQNYLSPEQLRELARLRGEMGSLRQTTAEIENLRAANERARAQLAQSEAPPPPDPKTVLAHWRKEQLSNAGYAEPQAAVQTVLSAMIRNDPAALLASVTPLCRTNLTREQWTIHNPPDQEVAQATQTIADSLNLNNGFYVVGEGSPKEGFATVDVYFEGEGRARRFYMRNVAGQWKFDSLNGSWPGGTWSWP